MDWRHTGLGGVVLASIGLWPGAAAAERVVYINTDPVVLNSNAGQDPTQNSYSTNGFNISQRREKQGSHQILNTVLLILGAPEIGAGDMPTVLGDAQLNDRSP